MRRSHILLLISMCISSTAIAGVYRHDKKESEYATLAAQPQFNCVGQVFDETGSRGSCVLVGSRYVLSAAHCFLKTAGRPVTTKNERGDLVTVTVPGKENVGRAGDYWVLFNNKKYRVKTLNIYPAYLGGGSKKCDMALLELEENVKDVAPAVLGTGFDELGTDVTGVGFGASGPADKPEDVALRSKKLAGENVIDSLGGFALDDKPTVMYCDFDDPAERRSKMGAANPRQLEYVCSGGDSGGGLFRQTKTGWELIGICSGTSMIVDELIKYGYYGGVMEWTRVSVFAEWIAANEK